MTDIWMWQTTMLPDDERGTRPTSRRDLTGYDVEASDGPIGKIDEASTEVDSGHLVVDTGWWIFGKKRLVPAGVVIQINDDLRKVFLSCSKDDIKAAPDYDDATDASDTAYRRSVGDHYNRRDRPM